MKLIKCFLCSVVDEVPPSVSRVLEALCLGEDLQARQHVGEISYPCPPAPDATDIVCVQPVDGRVPHVSVPLGCLLHLIHRYGCVFPTNVLWSTGTQAA